MSFFLGRPNILAASLDSQLSPFGLLNAYYIDCWSWVDHCYIFPILILDLRFLLFLSHDLSITTFRFFHGHKIVWISLFNCNFADKLDPSTLNRFAKMRFRKEIQTNWLGAITGMRVDLGMPLISFSFSSHLRLVWGASSKRWSERVDLMIFWRACNNYESWSYANCKDGSKGGWELGFGMPLIFGHSVCLLLVMLLIHSHAKSPPTQPTILSHLSSHSPLPQNARKPCSYSEVIKAFTICGLNETIMTLPSW